MSGSAALKERAQHLFEEGDYHSCLELIRSVPRHRLEIPIRIIEAVCLFCIGSLDEAEMSLRDLKARVSDSADVCLYLGKILEQKGDEGARAEYAAAVMLDPSHPEALRRYAHYLVSSQDHPAALSLLYRLHAMTGQCEDLSTLMNCLIVLGRPDLAIAEYQKAGSPDGCLSYLDALAADHRDDEIIRILDTMPVMPDDPLSTWRRLDALSRVDPSRADEEYLRLLKTQGSVELAARYIAFLSSAGMTREALGVWSTWCASSQDPGIRLLGVPLLLESENQSRALRLCEDVLFEHEAMEPGELAGWYHLYCTTLAEVCGKDEARRILLDHAVSSCHPAFCLEAARLCDEAGDRENARRLFFQAFRSDLISGGLAYAAYLANHGEIHEQEKILAYILKRVRKMRDLEKTASAVLSSPSPGSGIIQQLAHRFAADVRLLSTTGRDLYARTLCLSAEISLASDSPDAGVKDCITGLSVVPVESVEVARSLFAVLISCKRRSLPDHIPSYLDSSSPVHPLGISPAEVRFEWLDPAEEEVVMYLRKHRICHELDLRKVAQTRRVAGLMNRIMRKADAYGVVIVEKDGYSDFGEVYRYAGP